MRRELECLRCFGTDGEKALIDAFAHEFKFAIHLYCTIHMRNNIRDELHKENFQKMLSRISMLTFLASKLVQYLMKD